MKVSTAPSVHFYKANISCHIYKQCLLFQINYLINLFKTKVILYFIYINYLIKFKKIKVVYKRDQSGYYFTKSRKSC